MISVRCRSWIIMVIMRWQLPHNICFQKQLSRVIYWPLLFKLYLFIWGKRFKCTWVWDWLWHNDRFLLIFRFYLSGRMFLVNEELCLYDAYEDLLRFRGDIQRMTEELSYWEKKVIKYCPLLATWTYNEGNRSTDFSPHGFNSLDHLVWLVVPFSLLFTNLWIKLKEKMSMDNFSMIVQLRSKEDADFEIQRFNITFSSYPAGQLHKN